MVLTVPNWDTSKCVLWGIESNTSLMGPIIQMAPLDYVVGDILSLNFIEQPDGRVQPNQDRAWLNLVRNNPKYLYIAKSAVDEENKDDEKKISNTILACLDRFFELTIEQPQYMDLHNFEMFLAMCQISILAPEWKIVCKGFWIEEAESMEDIGAYRDVIDSFDRNQGKDFFATLDKNRGSVDVHCNYKIKGFADLALICTYLTLKSGKTFSYCKYCNRLFSPNRTGEIYCSRLAPEGKRQTCKEAAKYEKQLKRERASESGKIYKSVSTMLAARAEHKGITRDEVEDFRDKAKEFRNLIKQGKKTESEYISFLNSYD